MNSNALSLALILSDITSNPDYNKTYQSIAELTHKTLTAGHTVFICGNGGSHAIALHFASEFTGRFSENKPALPVMALGEATHTTCVGNDYGFNLVFSRQMDAFSKPGDLLIAMSTSGNSSNIIEIIELAKTSEMTVVSLLGKDGGKAKGLANHEFIVPSQDTARIQEIHQFLLHTLAEDVLKHI